MKNAIITGATGMVGGHVLDYCLESSEIGKVTSLVRRASGKQHEKLEEIIHKDFLELQSIEKAFENQDIAFFCLGAYTGSVNKELFRQINVDMPKAFAEMLKSKNKHVNFCLLSGAGADRTEKSRMQFARDKGTIENILDKMDLGEFHSFRPSYIYPVVPRDEPNFTYKLSRWLYKPLISRLGKNSSIKSTELAEAMFKVGVNGGGATIFENKDILDLL